MQAELENEKKKLAEQIKDFMNTMEQTEYFINEYHIIYKEVIKTVVNTELLKENGLYDEYSKKQITRPLSIK